MQFAYCSIKKIPCYPKGIVYPLGLNLFPLHNHKLLR